MEFNFSINNPNQKILNLFFQNKRKKAKNNILKTMGKDYFQRKTKAHFLKRIFAKLNRD